MRKRQTGKPPILDETDWKTMWLVCAKKMLKRHEPQLVKVKKVEWGWSGWPEGAKGSSAMQFWHEFIWREATADEVKRLNEKYGVTV